MTLTISEKLLAAVLATDAYNREYHSGLGSETVGLGEAGAIGNARVLARPNEMNLEAWQVASFHGVAYQITDNSIDGLVEGQIIIS